MKKFIFTFLLYLSFIGFVNAGTPFNLETFTGTVPAGDSLVTVGGVQYLKVLLNGWNTVDTIVPIITSKGYSINFTYFYYPDTSTYKLSELSGFIALHDSAGASAQTIQPLGSLVSTTPKLITKALKADTLTSIQLAAQYEAGSWPAISGAYIYMSQVTIKPLTFNLETFSGYLPDGDSVVNVGGTEYLKVLLNGWNSTLNIAPIITTKGNSMNFTYFYDQDTSTFKLADLSGFISLHDSAGVSAQTIQPLGSEPSTTPKAISQALLNDTLTNIQLAAQYKEGSWPAISGPYIYMTQVTIKPLTFNLETFRGYLPAGDSVVMVGNTEYLKVYLNGWNSTLNIAPIITTKGNSMNFTYFYDQDTSTFKLADLSGFISLHDSAGVSAQTIQPLGSEPSTTPKAISQALLNDTLTNIQLAAQYKEGSWPAISGPYIYMTQVTFKPLTFNLETFRGYLPAGDSVVMVGDTEYLKVYLNGWNSTLNIAPIITTQGTTINFTYFYDKDTSTYKLSELSGFIALHDSAGASAQAIQPLGSLVSTTPKFITKALKADTLTSIQLAAQYQSGSWPAISGPYIYMTQVTIDTSHVSVNNLTEDMSLKAFPNPASENLTVSLPGLTSYAIYDITGKVIIETVATGDIQNISVGNLANGIYIIKASDGTSVYTTKFIKK